MPQFYLKAPSINILSGGDTCFMIPTQLPRGGGVGGGGAFGINRVQFLFNYRPQNVPGRAELTRKHNRETYVAWSKRIWSDSPAKIPISRRSKGNLWPQHNTPSLYGSIRACIHPGIPSSPGVNTTTSRPKNPPQTRFRQGARRSLLCPIRPNMTDSIWGGTRVCGGGEWMETWSLIVRDAAQLLHTHTQLNRVQLKASKRRNPAPKRRHSLAGRYGHGYTDTRT